MSKARGKHNLRARAARFFDFLWCQAGPDDSTLADTAADSTLVDCPAVCHIERLPDSAFSEIFILSKASAPDAPIERVVSYVSPHWRTVALGCPDLWAIIDVRTPTLHQGTKLRWYLAHSAAHLVDIRLALSQETWYKGAGRLLLAAVLAEAPRLRRLALRADFSGADYAVRSACANLCAPHLEQLSLIFLAQPPREFDLVESHNFAPVLFAGGAPNLAMLRVQHLEETMFPPLGGVTTLHLEEYICAPMSFGRFRGLLDALPALVHLSLYGDVVEVWPTTGTLHLPQLRSLRGSATYMTGRVLSVLDAPALESLVLKDVRAGGFAAVGLRAPALQTLTLDGLVGARVVVALFCKLPRIAELRLINCDADDALELLETGGADGLLRGLRRAMVHQVRDSAVLERLSERGVAVRVHCTVPWGGPGVERWTRLPPWPSGQVHADPDDLFLQLRAR
ncbi:hypothetical protein B0H11DRAFT_1986460 [Mycena galericulata]|nr:hypothetical protein B0H11DRAFT_1986460 [Mycena galericulata]